MSLYFKPNKSNEQLRNVFNYNVEAFSDIVDIPWSMEALEEERAAEWELYSVHVDDEAGEIIAVLFVKEQEGVLLTKNTGLKISHQGQGYSHEIKDFFEDLAHEKGSSEIVSFCRKDDFRTISLNETHGYHQTNQFEDDKGMVFLEWTKKVSVK